jgi:ATP-dependent exoDNAse (exonuclease V) beta subunit
LHRRGVAIEAGRHAAGPLLKRHPSPVEAYAAAVAELRRSAGPAFRAPSRTADASTDAGTGASAGADAGADAGAGRPRERQQRTTSGATAGDPAIARAVGSVVHRLLEGWDGADRTWLAKRIPALCAQHAEEQIDARALEAAVQAVLGGFVNSALAGRLAKLDCVARELPLLFDDRSDDGSIYRGSIDLVYRDPDGHLVVVDYKTDHELDAGVLRERHAAQLGVYARALAAALKLEQRPRAELWLLRSGTIVEC